MAKDPEAGAMNEESISYLEEVKKGKPRKFAMICKGASVVSLVIYKKGNVEKRKKEAKEAGKGQFYLASLMAKESTFVSCSLAPTALTAPPSRLPF